MFCFYYLVDSSQEKVGLLSHMTDDKTGPERTNNLSSVTKREGDKVSLQIQRFWLQSPASPSNSLAAVWVRASTAPSFRGSEGTSLQQSSEVQWLPTPCLGPPSRYLRTSSSPGDLELRRCRKALA